MLKVLKGLAFVLAAPSGLLAAPIFPDSVESPIPGKQTALFVAFTDANETVIVGGVPQCTTNTCSQMGLLKTRFMARGYSDVQTMIATHFNELPPQSGQGYL